MYDFRRVHKNGAVLGILRGARGPAGTGRSAPSTRPKDGSLPGKAGAGGTPPGNASGMQKARPARASGMQRAQILGRIGGGNSKSCFRFTPHVSTRVPACQVYLVSYYSNRGWGARRGPNAPSQTNHQKTSRLSPVSSLLGRRSRRRHPISPHPVSSTVVGAPACRVMCITSRAFRFFPKRQTRPRLRW